MKIKVGQVTEYFPFDIEKLEGMAFSFEIVDERSILEGKVDIGILYLEQIPIQTEERFFVIAALSERVNQQVYLINQNGNRPFDFKNSAKLYSEFSIYAKQLLAINPALILVDRKDDADLILDHRPHKDSVNSFYFHPAEVTAVAGAGVMACIVHKDNITLRKYLSQIHREDVSIVTNLERMISQKLNFMEHAVSIQRDLNGYFHIHAVIALQNELKRIHFSSATSVGLVETVIQRLEI
jgi:porphobilinogen deaminase